MWSSVTMEMIWVEKYRPDKLEDVILDKNTKETLTKYIQDGIFPHLLLVGKAGTGKTTVARILNKQTNCEVLELNASNERGIETIRDKIGTFVRSKTMRDFRVVFLDEFDGMTSTAQNTLRNLMEKFSQNSRFILTANYPSKIIDPIKSRCITFEFKRLSKEEMKQRLKYILGQENVKFNSETVDEDLEKVIRFSRYDMRKSIQNLQRFSPNGELRISDDEQEYREILEFLMNKNLAGLKKYLAETEIDYQKVYRFLFEKINEPNKIVLLAEYYYRHHFVADPDINFVAMVIKW